MKIGLFLFFLLNLNIMASTITFIEDTTDFPNPERGLYAMRSVTATKVNSISGLRNSNITLVLMKLIPPNPYTNYNLPSNFLNAIQDSFNDLRTYGLKANVRFVYYENPSYDDPKKSYIYHHIEQLKPYFYNNQDVINLFEAGFIGPWGEWHSSSLANISDKRDILYHLLDNTPTNLMVCVRTPEDKRQIFTNSISPLGYDMIDLASSFNDEKFARVGFHNDCFVSSCNDVGTYPSCTERDDYIEYIGKETRYTPFGGESCDDADLSEMSHCDNSLYELETMHASYLHDNYSQYVIDRWSDEGCWETIKKKLGYRFVLKKITFSDSVQPGGVFDFEMWMTNTGFASPFHRRPVFLHFKNSNDDFAIELNTDSRYWLPHKSIHLHKQIRLQSSFPTGTYSLYLVLPDAHSSLSNNAYYSIRLANTGVWESSTGYNLLENNVVSVVSPSISGYIKNEDISGFDYGVDMSDQYFEILEPDGVNDIAYNHFDIIFKVLSYSNQKLSLFYEKDGKRVILKEYIHPSPDYFVYSWDTSDITTGVYSIGITMTTKEGYVITSVSPSVVQVGFENTKDFLLYPNPLYPGQTLTFDYKADVDDAVEFFIYNAMGEFVKKITDTDSYKLSTDDLLEGLYFVKMSINHKLQSKILKLVVVK